MPLRLVLVDDHPVVRQGFRALLEREGFVVEAEGADAHDAVRLAGTHRPDVAVLDLGMPGMGGDAPREIVRCAPDTKVVYLTVHTEEYQVVAALRAGVRGYVLKTQAGEELVQAIRQVAAGGTYLSPKVAHIIAGTYAPGRDGPAHTLTPRERQVMQLVATGRTSKEVASTLGLSVKTAESYRTRLIEKLGVQHTVGLVRWAIRNGLLEPVLAIAVGLSSACPALADLAGMSCDLANLLS